MPISIINAVWLGFEIFNPQWKKKALIVYAVVAVVFYIAEFGSPDQMYTLNASVNTLNANGEMINISLASIIQGLTLFIVLTAIFVLGGGFYMLSRKVTGVDRKRAAYISIGYVIFGAAAIFEVTLGNLGDAYKIIARVMMATYLVFIYLGFTLKTTAKPRCSHNHCSIVIFSFFLRHRNMWVALMVV